MKPTSLKGRLIVIDGPDGSGKTTQTDLLMRRLRKEGYPTAQAHFPRYGMKSAGPVEDYLSGQYGTAEAVGPYAGSIFYAVDRYAASEDLRRKLTQGSIIVSDRYVSANMGHQGAKIRSPQTRRTFLKWLYNLEHGIFNIPKPDIGLVLHMPIRLMERLIKQRKGKRDIHEADHAHLKAAEQCYLEVARLFPRYHLIECVEKNRLLTPLEVHEKVWDIVRKVL